MNDARFPRLVCIYSLSTLIAFIAKTIDVNGINSNTSEDMIH